MATKLNSSIAQNSTLDEIRRQTWRVTDINSPDDQGIYPLMQATKYQRLEVVQLLLSLGADVDIEDEFGRNSIHVVLEDNAIRLTRPIMEKNPVTNTISRHDGSYPLGIAVAMNNSALIKLLVRCQLRRNSSLDCTASTALLKAIAWGRIDLVKILLASGADTNLVQCDMTVLDTLLYAWKNNGLSIVFEGKEYPLAIYNYEYMLAYESKCQLTLNPLWVKDCVQESDSGLIDLYETLFDYGVKFENHMEFPKIPRFILDNADSRMLQILLWQNIDSRTILTPLGYLLEYEKHENIKLILRYLALKSIGQVLDLPAMSSYYIDYYATCRDEVQNAMREKISDVTYYDLLFSPYNKTELQFTRYFKEVDLGTVKHSFNSYGESIRTLSKRATTHERLLQDTRKVIGQLIHISIEDHPEILDSITHYFKKHELQNVLYVF